MKNLMTYENWSDLEKLLAKLGVGYQVMYDNHNGIPEMIIDINSIGIYRYDMSFKKGENNV